MCVRVLESVADANRGGYGVELVVGLESAHGRGSGDAHAGERRANQVGVVTLGVVGPHAEDIHERRVDAQTLDGAEREADGRLNLGHAGGLGVVVVGIDGGGVDHQTEAGVETAGDGILRAQREAPCVGILLVDVLVELLGQRGKLDVEAHQKYIIHFLKFGFSIN